MIPEEPTIEITQRDGKYEAVASLGEHRGWALQKTEALARAKALLRLRGNIEGWFR